MRSLLPLCCLLIALTACDKDSREDLDADGYPASEDCDDDNPDVFPGAEEVCDGVDNDCNDEVDEGVQLTFFTDSDGDGHGAPDAPVSACEATGGLAISDQDCDDTDADVYPGAPEEDCADPVDYNCDGSVAYQDADSDGWAACEDCDDTNSEINGDADEVCDGVDNDCNGTVDGADASDALPYYLDSDQDGFGDPAIETYDCEAPEGYSAHDTDCDDTNAQIYPGAEEICDGLDSDCNSATAEVRYPSDYSDLQLAIESGEPEICIEAGTHSVNLDLNGVDTLKLIGAGGSDAVFLDGGGARVIDMGSGASNIELSGLTLQNVNEFGQDGLGIRANACSNVLLHDIVVRDISGDSGNDTGLAIGFTQCNDVTIEESAVHSATATYTGSGDVYSYGLVGITYCESVVVDGLEIYESSIDGFYEVYGGAFGFLGSGPDATLSINDLRVHDLSETNTRSFSYGAVLSMAASDVDMSNVSVSEVVQEANDVTSAVFVFQTQGDVDVHNVSVVANSSTATSTQHSPQFWAYGSTGDVALSNILSAGNTNVANSVSHSNSIWLYNLLANSYEAQNITVHGNSSTATSDRGGGMLTCNGAVSIRNSSVSGNSVNSGASIAGVGQSASQTACVPTASYNNVYDNGINFDTVADFTGSNGNIGVDPGFVDVSSSDPLDWDLTLASGSGLIDAGDPAVLDADGTTSDIGAYGGPDGESWE